MTAWRHGGEVSTPALGSLVAAYGRRSCWSRGEACSAGTPAGVPLIDDPANRLYRGLDQSLYPFDRVEVVSFPKAGVYLVICGVLPHFVEDDMFGFVTVLPIGGETE